MGTYKQWQIDKLTSPDEPFDDGEDPEIAMSLRDQSKDNSEIIMSR